MEGDRRKRKLEEEEEEENEEQKMEKFFALIRSTKDLLSKEKTDNKVDEKKEKGIWNPTFQLEDFIGYGEPVGKSNVSVTDHHAGPSEKEKEGMTEKENLQEETTTAAAAVAPAEENEVKEKASDSLDLNLSL